MRIWPSRLGPRHCGQSSAHRLQPAIRPPTRTRTPKCFLIAPPSLITPEVYITAVPSERSAWPLWRHDCGPGGIDRSIEMRPLALDSDAGLPDAPNPCGPASRHRHYHPPPPPPPHSPTHTSRL